MPLGKKSRYVLVLLGMAWLGAGAAQATGFKLRHCIQWPSVRCDGWHIIVGEQPWAGNLAPWWTYFPYDPRIVNQPASVYPTWPSQFPPAQAERIASPQMAPRFPPNPTPMPAYAPANPGPAFGGGPVPNFYFDR
ncbi:MAG: hypothetical protein L0215_10995 [Gemmataceae bacterium]|nr:hypothetical protein [Gemmataceae bacterium]